MTWRRPEIALPNAALSSPGGRRAAVSTLFLVAAALILVRGASPLQEYGRRLLETHTPAVIAAGAAALLVAIGLLFFGIRRRPRSTWVVLGLLTAMLLVVSGNAGALAMAAGILTLTLLAGDGISRTLRGGEAEDGEIATSIAAGIVTLGLLLLLLGEAGLARPLPLSVAAVFLLLTCARRIPPLARRVGARAAGMAERRYSALEALWLSIVVAGIGASFLGTLRPDVFFDSVAYHLPEIRDFAIRGRVVPIPGVFETSLWHNYETFLGAAFVAGGEPVVGLVHFGVGLAAFASAATLARRIRDRASAPLALLCMAAVPTICAQLKETLVELPTALLLTAAASELVSGKETPRRPWLAGFLFGGAVAAKIFALWGLVALLILLIARGTQRWRRVLAFGLFAAIPLLPWLGWSQARLGFFLSPYSDPILKAGTAFPFPAGELAKPWTRYAPHGLDGFVRLPYQRTFGTIWFGREGDGILGFLPLALLVGLLGWDRRRLLIFSAAAIWAVVPWYALSAAKLVSPSIRFLTPLYPLYAVFAAAGLAQATGNFRGRTGWAAGAALSALAIGFPAQFFSLPLDLKMALGRIPIEQGLSAYLPAYPLWKEVRPEDRVLLFGEWDRYHCPAEFIIRDIDLPIPLDDARGWWTQIERLRISRILSRSDTRNFQPLSGSFAPCVDLVARNGPASLWRVRDPGECRPALHSLRGVP